MVESGARFKMCNLKHKTWHCVDRFQTTSAKVKLNWMYKFVFIMPFYINVLFVEHTISFVSARTSANGPVQFRLWGMKIQSQPEVGT